MDETHDRQASPYGAIPSVAGVDFLLVEGNVQVDKNKGPGQLLLTRPSLFAFRQNSQAMMAGGAAGGLLGALIGHLIDRHRAKKRPPPEHVDDPEIRSLADSARKKVERSALLAKIPLDGLKIERTRLGFKFTGGETQVVFQGLFHKNKITGFLATLGIDAR